MRADKSLYVPAGHAGCSGFRKSNAAAACGFACRGLCLLVVFLIFSFMSIAQAGTACQRSMDSLPAPDSRWSPWIGSWQLISNTVDAKDGSVSDDFILKISPSDDRRSIVMKGSQKETVLFEHKIVVDGSRRPLKDEDCEGWYAYSWSDTGKRLLFDSESVCPDERPRTISGLSFFVDTGTWVDVQLLTGEEERVITIRRYREADSESGASVRSTAFNTARIMASTNFSIDEIIELSGKVAPEAMEAAIMEMHQPFKINSKVLVRLADAGVPSQIVDLMVALSFPDKFTVERHSVEPVEMTEGRELRAGSSYYAWSPFGIWSYYDPWFHWYWNTYGYGLYGYWGWNYWPGYYAPYWGSGGSGGGAHHGIGGGILVAGEGYTRVRPNSGGQPRYANPRSRSAGSGRLRPNSGTASGSSSSGRTQAGTTSGGHSSPSYSAPSASSGGGGASSAGPSYSGGGAPSASPGGYSGGSHGGGSARPRE
jgi:hypothetical protein